MTQRAIDFLLVGGGTASVSAADTLRREGAAGSILMVCGEQFAPYQRPPLSKRILLGASEDVLPLRPEAYYRDLDIQMAQGMTVTAVDPAAHDVTLASGEHLHYGQLMIATGARPRMLAAARTDLGGVYTLHTRLDAERVRASALVARRAVVVGASYLGLEVALSLHALGLEVTMVERGSVVLRHLKSLQLSSYFLRHARDAGIRLLLQDRISQCEEEHGHVSAVVTAAGERLPCDMVVSCIGVQACTDFLVDSGLELDHGWIVVDEQLRTNVPDVYAAGDVTSFFDPVFGRRRHIEHADNAHKQGRLAARNMLGQRLRYDEVSYFFCEVGEIGFNVLGEPEEGSRHVGRGSLAERSYALFYLAEGGVPRALFSMGRPADETRTAESFIRHRTPLEAAERELANPAFPLNRIPAQTVLILQGGGALGAFECGVVRALEEKGIYPDIVAGVSIGALNGAIIASHPRHATDALESFWADLTVATARYLPTEAARGAALMNILMFGVGNFFTPRWTPTWRNFGRTPLDWTSFYDTAPMKQLITRYVDFSRLRQSPVRLLVSAVNVATARLEVFDNYVDDLTPEHLLASGSLPPGFPWTTIDGQQYWDGGIVSNSPLDLVIDRCGPDGKRVFVVDLFSEVRELPANLMEVFARRDEIVYAERIRSDTRQQELVSAYRALVQHILDYVDPETLAKIRQRPRYIELMGNDTQTSVIRLVRRGRVGEHSSRDYDFSDIAIRASLAEGYALTRETLERLGEEESPAGK